MNRAKFIWWETKKILPVFFVLLLVSSAIVWIGALDSPVYRIMSQGYYSLHDYYEPRVILCTILGVVSAFVLPFFVFDYRYDKLSASAYRQAPTKRNEIRNLKILICLACVILLFSFIFISNLIIILIKYHNTPASFFIGDNTALRYNINFGYFFPAYLVGLLAVILTYFSNVFLASLGNNVNISIIFVIAGNIILLVGTFVIPCWILTTMFKESVTIGGQDYSLWEFLGSLQKDFTFVDKLTNRINYKTESMSTEFLPVYLFSSITRLAIVPACFITKEPSGEFYNAYGSNRLWKRILIYISYGMIIGVLSCLIIDGDYSVIDIIIFPLLSFAYFYLNTSIFNKRFKPNKEELIVYGLLFGSFILSLVGSVILRELCLTTATVV